MSDRNEVIDREFPRWYYGPDGQSRIFQRGEEVPEGWEDHPSKVTKVIEEAEIVEPKVSQSEAKRIAEQSKETPKTKEEVAAGITPPENVGGSPNPVVEGALTPAAASDDNSRGSSDPEADQVGKDAPMTKEEIYEGLLLKDMPELRGMADELGIDQTGKKHQLANRIAEKFYEAQEVNMEGDK